MTLSFPGVQMAARSGLRTIMEDIARSMQDSADTSWINLGIGNPAAIPEVTAAWQRLATAAVADSFGQAANRYGPSRGTPELVGAIASYFRRRYGWDIGPANIVVSPGSQMICFMTAALFTGPGEYGTTDLVLPMLPDYTGYQGITLTAGTLTGVLPELRTQDPSSFRYLLDFPAVERLPRMGMLLMSSPSNPAGRRADHAELSALVGLAEDRGIPLLLDNAYGAPFPVIGDDLLPPVLHRNVINSFSLSKMGLPGERIAFAIADERYISPMVSFLTNSALHAPQIAQTAVARALESGELDALVASVVTPFYAERRKMAEALLRETLPESVPWRLHASDGGMFSWIWVDADWFTDLALYERLKAKGVFVVPGRYFFSDPDSTGPLGSHPRQCIRFSLTASEADIRAGVELLAAALVEMRDDAARNARR
jgi:valine--pyruvate aminotransferase